MKWKCWFRDQPEAWPVSVWPLDQNLQHHLGRVDSQVPPRLIKSVSGNEARQYVGSFLGFGCFVFCLRFLREREGAQAGGDADAPPSREPDTGLHPGTQDEDLSRRPTLLSPQVPRWPRISSPLVVSLYRADSNGQSLCPWVQLQFSVSTSSTQRISSVLLSR